MKNIEDIKAEVWKEAASEVKGWADLLIKAHSECTYTNPEDAEREFQNQLRFLNTIHSRFLQKANVSDKDRFRMAMDFSR